MSDERNQVAQEKFGKDFDELDGHQRQQVGGTIGGEHRKEQMAAEHGGDASAGYSEMGSKGGSGNTKEDDDEQPAQTQSTGDDKTDERNQVAQEKYGKDFDELEAKERQSVGGTIGGKHRAQ